MEENPIMKKILLTLSLLTIYHSSVLAAAQQNERGRYTCPQLQCRYECNFRANLQRHMHTMHPNMIIYACPYDGCTYNATYLRDLTRHLTRHTEEPALLCESFENLSLQNSQPKS